MLLLKICFSRTIFKNIPKQSCIISIIFFGLTYSLYLYTRKKIQNSYMSYSKNT